MRNSKQSLRKVGRPAFPAGVAKRTIVPVRFKPADRKRLEAAARDSKKTVSEWIRNTLAAAMNA